MNTTFDGLNLLPEIAKALTEMNFTTPTPIQLEVIPEMLTDKDIIAQAPTGTGKTCAFGIPLIQKATNEACVQSLILCPTRELAVQITEELINVAKFLPQIKLTTLYGGQSIDRQFKQLRANPQIVVGTPGRVIDHLQRGTLKLEGLKTLVLDEADEMLNMGFREDIDLILKSIVGEHNTVLFSATLPRAIMEISKSYQKNPAVIKTTHNQSAIPNIEQYYVVINEEDKIPTLTKLIDDNNIRLGLVFCGTKKRTDELATALTQQGYSAEALHGDLPQSGREKIMKKYRSGSLRLLIATDVAARGIDVDNIEAVFNFDIPQDLEYYVHRIGRTARANNTGKSFTFFKSSQLYQLKDCERYTKVKMEKMEVPVSKAAVSNQKIFATLKHGMKKIEDFKETIAEAIKEFNFANFTQHTPLDLCAALLKSQTVSVVMSESFDEAGGRKRGSSRNVTNDNHNKYFMNVGSKDSLNEQSLVALICNLANLKKSDILNVRINDMFSFFETDKSNDVAINSISGNKHGRRVINIEPAGKPKDNKSSSDGASSNDRRRDNRAGGRRPSDNNSFRPSRNKSFGSAHFESNGSEGASGSSSSSSFTSENAEGSTEKPRREFNSSFDRKPRRDGGNFDRKPRRDGADFDRKPRTDGESFDKKPSAEGEGSFDRKPRREYGSSFDRKPRTDGESFDKKPNAEGEGSFDRKPRREYGSSFDRKPRAEGEGSFDRKPRERKSFNDSDKSKSPNTFVFDKSKDGESSLKKTNFKMEFSDKIAKKSNNKYSNQVNDMFFNNELPKSKKP